MKNEKWIIPTAVTIIVIVLCLAAAGSYAVYDYIFPMADPISCPAEAEILSISLGQNGGTPVAVEISNGGARLETMQKAQPTRIMCIQDYPAAESYYTLEMNIEERFYRYFIYEENAQVYIEHPYVGIYKADREFLDEIAALYN